MSWTIAPVDVADADEVGRVHVAVWQEAYAGLMPADYLAALDPVAFAARLAARLARPDARGAPGWPATTRASSGSPPPVRPATTTRPPRTELYAINVLARGHGTGVADELMAHAIGDRAAYLWVLEGNDRATAFYRRHGFADDGGRKPEPDTGVVEIRMSRDSLGRRRPV